MFVDSLSTLESSSAAWPTCYVSIKWWYGALVRYHKFGKLSAIIAIECPSNAIFCKVLEFQRQFGDGSRCHETTVFRRFFPVRTSHHWARSENYCGIRMSFACHIL
ncbi:hypothetical protein AVEN_22840-1 [Araneus ventricosus]|uniref:Uncharacterized protein n=1 Tax=Araneus ventricosus TaxID=182803 RepID=A0A4Y2L955_ARAVE|nr:hypothetical protein AVEN_22840-1 [Araneus ventricosus]